MIVVTDTSVILNLCCIGQEYLLLELFGTLLAPPSVAGEFERLATTDPRFQSLVLPPFIRIVPPKAINPALANNRKLDAGEIDALSLAEEIGADAVLIDEKAGRAAATSLGLAHVGILGIFLEAKKQGHLATIRPQMEQLESKAGFWIAPPLKQRVLDLVDE